MRPVHGGNLAWAAALAGCSPAAILDFSASISPLGPPKSAIAAIQASLGNLSYYPDPDYRELRSALSHVHQLPPEWILPGNGSAELLTWAGWDLAKLAATCLVTPAFGDYWRALKAFDAKVLECPLNLGTLEQGSRGAEGLLSRGATESIDIDSPQLPCPRVPVLPCSHAIYWPRFLNQRDGN